MFGRFGEASEVVHGLVEHIAKSRVRVALPQKGKRGVNRSECREKAMAVSFVRRSLSLAESSQSKYWYYGMVPIINSFYNVS